MNEQLRRACERRAPEPPAFATHRIVLYVVFAAAIVNLLFG